MTTDREPVLTGGCQCGAVRYALYAEPAAASICHCRMCQKAMGNLFSASASVPRKEFAWTAGAPATWQSSQIAERGFCQQCGTPLSFRYLTGEQISVSTGSLDEPARAKPTAQIGIESKVPWLEEALGLPGKTTEENAADALAGMKNLQHPDREA